MENFLTRRTVQAVVASKTHEGQLWNYSLLRNAVVCQQNAIISIVK